ncbi:pentapeptide repeat-containing protein [Arsenophonus nasoniae]|uniref:pentapeptide repeat-containing protein n=1 Tax=Arsenophonus nasoniae TaxID=638 RepID=UPI00387926B4
MSYINTNIDHYTKFMESNLGINDMDVKKATSPNTILEHIIDFITFGGVKKELTKQYSEFCSKIVDTLEQSNGLDRYEIPKNLKFNFSGKDVIFSNNDGFVSINVEGKVAEKRIDEKCFNNFCTIQLLMKREGLSEHQARLTNDGNICLANADLSNRDLSGIDLRGAELHDVNLSNSDLSFSNLKGAQLQFTRLDSVCYGKQAERNTCMSNLCDYLKTTYQIDSEGKRNSKSDGLFRVSANHTDFLDIKKAFNEGNINFEEHLVHSLIKILADECKRLSPIDDLMLIEVKSGQEEFLSIFNKKVQSMIPEERKEFEIILGLYADAYDSAEDGNTSSFNKNSILTGSFYPSLFLGGGQTIATDIETISKQREFSKEIITSFKHLNDVELPVLHDNRNIHSQSVEKNKTVNEVDPSHARTRSELVKARKAFFEQLTSTNVNNLKQPISTGASRDVTTLRKFFDNNSPS